MCLKIYKPLKISLDEILSGFVVVLSVGSSMNRAQRISTVKKRKTEQFFASLFILTYHF